MSRQEHIDRFLAASRLYFRLTDAGSTGITGVEVEEVLELIDPDSEPMLCPDQHIA